MVYPKKSSTSIGSRMVRLKSKVCFHIEDFELDLCLADAHGTAILLAEGA